jgi:hypothetical protein
MIALNAELSKGAIFTGSKLGAPHCKKPGQSVRSVLTKDRLDFHIPP